MATFVRGGEVTKPARFTSADLTRAVNAMRKAGLCVAGAKIEPDGSITVLTGDNEAANDRNPLDRILSQ
jgi:hypothetical protein